ncbi:L-rhamnose mutarotase [Chitinophaga costaii]|uniref:L-rhamnose mutarotase n=1 Tax=Chitinophaga costaii TaxID=1335309 RepID=A0A1C4CNP8_9BACT|nr:L-rhamnose mutarotase [Chitinophaga costaii]PUZ27015.1 L-rhamnose mutarotase [Chitinophaga costaii]SCC20737.1 L-rhamnose mutarotase [Chitinophaga costaii]
MKKHCLALDLINDPQAINAYDAWHQKVWPEVLQSIRASGIQRMEIYRTGNRLFMIMETTDDFSFARKAAADAANERVQAWETLMEQYQQRLPFANEGEKWKLMEKILDY